jgi:4-hydroxybenzoate polyprenyltransferase
MARIVVMLVMVAAPLPYVARLFGIGYALAVLFIEAVFVWMLFALAGRPSRASIRRASNGLKLVMLVGLVGFVLGVLP